MMDAMKRITDGEVRADLSLIGRAAYEASLAACPIYFDGTPRPSWDELNALARWSWERQPRQDGAS
jgi:hypothetical protein